MWKRNLLFIGVLVVAGLGLLSLWPRQDQPEHWQQAEPSRHQEESFTRTVAQIDDSFRRQWSDSGLRPAAQADELAVIRRVSLALTGTIPSLEEIRLLQSRPADDRIAWWIDGLLRDRRSSEYLAERFARAYVSVEGGQFVIYRRSRFVSWLSDELHANRGYDEICRAMIAADGLWTSEPATNFITAAIKPDSDVGVQENVMAARVARAFLGVRLDCAECHDHPFNDAWKLDHFHGLAAFFGPTRQSFTGIRDIVEEGQPGYQRLDRDTLEELTVSPAVPFLPELLPDAGPMRERLAHWVTHRENKAFARTVANRVWAILFGRPLIEPVDDIPLDCDVEPLNILADDFVEHDYDLRRLISLVAASGPFRLDSQSNPAIPGHEVTEAHESCWAAFPITRLRPEQVAGSVLQATSLATIDHESNVFVRLARGISTNDFVTRYGDMGQDEYTDRGGTIPQRLIMMNGSLVRDRTNAGTRFQSVHQVGQLSPSDEKVVEIAYLVCFSRQPTPEEQTHFVGRLAGTTGEARQQVLEDLFWDLLNSTEFAFNH